MSGDINANNIGVGATLKTMSGDAVANDVGEDASVTTMSGDVRVHSKHESASISTISGDIYENGVRKRKQAQSQYGSSSVSINGVSMMFGGGGRIIMNGRDVTDLVNGASNSSKGELEDKPIRYRKG